MREQHPFCPPPLTTTPLTTFGYLVRGVTKGIREGYGSVFTIAEELRPPLALGGGSFMRLFPSGLGLPISLGCLCLKGSARPRVAAARRLSLTPLWTAPRSGEQWTGCWVSLRGSRGGGRRGTLGSSWWMIIGCGSQEGARRAGTFGSACALSSSTMLGRRGAPVPVTRPRVGGIW